jgi:hypothetical protein
MPKVISGVQGAKDFATEGKVQTIPDVTNRQGAKLTLEKRVAAVIEAKTAETKAAEIKARGWADPKDTINPGDKVTVDAKVEEGTSSKPAEVTEDPNEGVDPADMDLAERARKSIARKHRELKKAQADLGKLQTDLSDTENFSKAQYARAAAAEEKVAELQRELEGLKANAPQPAPAEPILKKPDPKDYYDDKGQFKLAEYTEAVGEYSAKKAIADKSEADTKERKKQEAEAAEAAKQAAMERVKKLTEAQSKEYKDWNEVVPANPVQVHNLVAAYLTASPYPGHIAYYLAKNSEYAKALREMHPLAAIAELGELSIRWKKTGQNDTQPNTKPIKEETRPPAPITLLPGSGSVGATTDPSKMTPAQLRAYDRERALAKRRA